MLEHLFLSRLLREAWSRRETTIEVLRPEVDVSGYDVVLEHRGIGRHVQLKASKDGSMPGYYSNQIGLSTKPAGCVTAMVFQEGNLEEKLNLRYFFYSGAPNEPLNLEGFPAARRATNNAEGVRPERPAVRNVPKGRFRELSGIRDVYVTLFGENDPVRRG